jgi:hypothetical protein
MICSGDPSFGTGDPPGKQCLHANILTYFSSVAPSPWALDSPIRKRTKIEHEMYDTLSPA